MNGIMDDIIDKAKTSREIGEGYEQKAYEHLKKSGLTLKDKNYNCKVGEIDLIMKDKDFYVFVEVRYRKQKNYGEPIATVGKSKQRKIIKTALYYLMEKDLFEKVPCRFDVVAISNDDGKEKIEWIKSAFDDTKR